MNRLTPFVTEIYQDTLGLPLDSVLDEINRRRRTDPGLERSNVGGYHSAPFVPTVADPTLHRLAALSSSRIDEIAVGLGLGRLRLNGLWINVSEPGNRNDWHTHPFTVLSAVYYVSVPTGSGDLRIERPDIQSHYWRRSSGDDPRTASIFRYTPNSDDLLIFPAYLRHDVEANRATEPRISIAMNYSY